MFRLNLKIAFRNLLKNKVYTLINILGLSIGMASCILIFLFVRAQLNYDQGFLNGDRIYRFVTDWKYNSFDDYSSGVPLPLSAAMRTEVSSIEKVANISKNGGVVQVKDQLGNTRIKATKTFYFAEPEIFDIFQLDWLSARPVKELREPNTVVLSETEATALFGDANTAVGKHFTFWNSVNLKVVGVFRDMQVSSVPMDIVISYPTFYGKNNKDWNSVNGNNQCFMLLKAGVTAEAFQKDLVAFNKKHFTDQTVSGNQISVLEPLNNIHFSERYWNFAETSVMKKQLYGLGIIGLFLILTACINFINLATAQSVNRSKEVGVRKVLGSERSQLISQFLTETVAVALLSLLIACVLAELAIPFMQNLFKDDIVFSLFGTPSIFLFLLVLVILVSFLAGLYPAIVMSGFKPALALKNKITVNTKSLGLRKVLVVVQFAITIILIIGTLVIIGQMNFLRSKPLGFRSDAIVVLNMPGESRNASAEQNFSTKLKQINGVERVGFGYTPPLSGAVNSTNFNLNGEENMDFEVRLLSADEQYFKLFNLQILAGKTYSQANDNKGYVVNETFYKKAGYLRAEAILGQIINQNGIEGPIVGVVKDFNDKSLKESISPIALYSLPRQYECVFVRIAPEHVTTAFKEVEAVFNASFPNEVYSGRFVDQEIQSFYDTEKVMSVLFKFFAGVIIFISFIGLFGLISFVAKQRSREVAIRKVLGATTVELVRMLNGSFLLMVFLANVLAWPLAYVFVSGWLSGFAYRMNLSIWPFAIAMAISMAITLATVSLRSYKAAVANTVDALKYE
ncbi:MAG: ABC transporter permease [Pedobacter sp.]